MPPPTKTDTLGLAPHQPEAQARTEEIPLPFSLALRVGAGLGRGRYRRVDHERPSAECAG